MGKVTVVSRNSCRNGIDYNDDNNEHGDSNIKYIKGSIITTIMTPLLRYVCIQIHRSYI